MARFPSSAQVRSQAQCQTQPYCLLSAQSQRTPREGKKAQRGANTYHAAMQYIPYHVRKGQIQVSGNLHIAGTELQDRNVPCHLLSVSLTLADLPSTNLEMSPASLYVHERRYAGDARCLQIRNGRSLGKNQRRGFTKRILEERHQPELIPGAKERRTRVSQETFYFKTHLKGKQCTNVFWGNTPEGHVELPGRAGAGQTDRRRRAVRQRFPMALQFRVLVHCKDHQNTQ